MRVLDLFSGIGGFSLAAHTVGFETAAFCEIEPYAQQVLRRHFPGVPIFDDVKELTADALADAKQREAERRGESRVVACPSREAESGAGSGVRHTTRSSREDESRAGSSLLAEPDQEGFRPLLGGMGEGGGAATAVGRGRDNRERVLEPVPESGRRRSLADAASVRQCGNGAPERAEGCGERRVQQSPRGDSRLILTAGFPCQDISYAGKGAGLDGERSGLFYEVARLVGELRPDYVLLENVAALLTRGLDAVLGTLASLGYDAVYACVPACAVGAPHRRDRVWILAVPNGSRERLTAMYAHVLSRLTPFGDLAEGWPTATASDAWASDKERNQVQPCTGRVLTGKAGLGLGHAAAMNGTRPTPASRDYKDSGENTNYERGAERCILPGTVVMQEGVAGALSPDWTETLMGYPIGYTLPDGEPMVTLPNVWPAGLGAPQHEWEPPRLTTEKQHRASRLKCLGNSIVPQVAVLWMEAIALDSIGGDALCASTITTAPDAS